MADTQSPVQMLVESHAGEAVPPGCRGNLPASLAKFHTVILPHVSLMMHREDAIELISDIRDESGSFLSRRDGPGLVMERDPGVLREGISHLPRRDSRQAKLLGEPFLSGLPEPLHAFSGLWRVGGDRFNAQLPQGALNLGWARRLLRLMGA